MAEVEPAAGRVVSGACLPMDAGLVEQVGGAVRSSSSATGGDGSGYLEWLGEKNL